MGSNKPASAKMPNLTGRIINNGQYQLLKELGSGSYGVVYKATTLVTSEQTKSGQDVAIKIMNKASMGKRNARQARREVAIHKHMSHHPNVVTMHEAFEDEDYVYIVMQYCPGGDLFGRICEEKVYYRRDELVKKLFLQLLDAVQACHHKRVFHRDLKPENILLSEDGTELYISDFGLATTNQVGERFGCGSSYYMSPECIGKETGYLPYSNRANDIWALGVILVNMVSCRSPWTKAVTMDDCFSDFMLHRNYLREMMPISREANDIFRQIFTFDYIERMTIPALRKAIEKLDTFFMSDDEIAVGTDAVRIAASYCGHHVDPVVVAKDRMLEAERSPRVIDQKPNSIKPSPLASSDAFVIGSASTSDTWTSEESTSESESDGPVTPATCAQDPAIEIPLFKLRLDDEILEVKEIAQEKGRGRSLRRRFISLAL